MTTVSHRYNVAPVLPRELEFEIFDLCAATDRKMRHTLIQVARRVQEWIQPYIYRVMDLGESCPGDQETKLTDLLVMINSKTKPPEFFQKHVKTLLLDTEYLGNGEILRLLHTFSNIRDLTIWLDHGFDGNDVPEDVIDSIVRLPLLTRLWTNDANNFLNALSVHGHTLTNVTHLHLGELDPNAPLPVPEDLSTTFPCLTHFSVMMEMSNPLDLLLSPPYFLSLFMVVHSLRNIAVLLPEYDLESEEGRPGEWRMIVFGGRDKDTGEVVDEMTRALVYAPAPENVEDAWRDRMRAEEEGLEEPNGDLWRKVDSFVDYSMKRTDQMESRSEGSEDGDGDEGEGETEDAGEESGTNSGQSSDEEQELELSQDEGSA